MATRIRRAASRAPRGHAAGERGLEVVVLDRQRARRISATRLRGVIQRAALELGVRRGELAVVLARDVLVRRLNRTYRRKDVPTDVLSFEGAPNEGQLGDIVISVDTAARQAREQGRPLAQELDVLVLHGFLHLLGHDHEKDDGTMSRLEGRLRRRLLGTARGVRSGRQA
jgi:probable rRNA maturation factor